VLGTLITAEAASLSASVDARAGCLVPRRSINDHVRREEKERQEEEQLEQSLVEKPW